MNVDLVYVMPASQVRERLSLELACAALGIDLGPDRTACCPFHQERTPSFGLYASEDGTHERWKCFGCGAGGDVFDLIMRREGGNFQRAVGRARRVLAGAIGTSERRSPPPRAVFDPVSLELLLEDARAEARGRLADLALAAGFEPEWAEVLVREWGWGLTRDGWALIPHWDKHGTLTGVKARSLSGAKSSVPGSRYPALYGSWRPADDRPVLICEGETDTVWASVKLQAWRAVGLPSGAASFRPEWTRALAGREVWLVLDPDDPGQRGAARWLDALPKAINVVLPSGKDLRDAAPSYEDVIRFAT